ncbi:hypothetical protein CDV36_011217 [Fusarium kuroshium]|uniref:Uncharacterized protein n=1 Tax=Fusarium kuroshium TaxID=2010991 RepID=A0A3M2RV30_9HYPO|nr:hypothetical protein CDV36_011217 [Fusarium kuroshium]
MARCHQRDLEKLCSRLDIYAGSFKIEKGGRDPDPVLRGGDAELSRLASETSASSSISTKTALTPITENTPTRYRRSRKDAIIAVLVYPPCRSPLVAAAARTLKNEHELALGRFS